MNTQFQLTVLLGAGFVLFGHASGDLRAAVKPNIVLINADDMR